MSTYEPTHVALRAFGSGVAAGDLINIPDPSRAAVMINQHLVRPLTANDDVPRVAYFVEVDAEVALGNETAGSTSVGSDTAVVMENEAMNGAERPEQSGAVRQITSSSIRKMPGVLADIDDPDLLRRALTVEKRTSARAKIKRRLAELEE